MILSVTSLTLGVLAYGVAGARLSDGARGDTHPLRSAAWWTGTALQGAGFGFTLLARSELPLLIVQAAVVGGLAVTAILQHLTGTRSLGVREAGAIGVLMTGIGLLAATTVPGAAVPLTGLHVAVTGIGVAICLGTLPLRLHPGLHGVLSGLGFAISAVTARLLIAAVTPHVLAFWSWPWTVWAAGFLLVGGLVLGQVHLTRGLARAHAVGVLGANYVMSTLVPAVIGVTLLHELPRPGTHAAALAGIALSLVGALFLLRGSGEPAIGEPTPSSTV